MYVFGLIWYWRSNIGKFWFSKPFFYVENLLNLSKKISLKNPKMGDKLFLIPYFDNFDFRCTLFSKNAPKFWCLVPNQTKLLEYFNGHFHRPLAQLSYIQLFKWGHSKFESTIVDVFDFRLVNSSVSSKWHLNDLLNFPIVFEQFQLLSCWNTQFLHLWKAFQIPVLVPPLT